MSISVKDEAARLSALHDLRLLDTSPSESFDRITRMASQLFDLPVSAVSLTDSDRQWFKSRVGVDLITIPREKAPCAHVAETCQVVVIEDFLSDPNYRDSPLALSGVRFYAGAPLITTDGYGLGAMCVLGTQPRQATPSETASLQDLALMVMAQIELQHAFGRLDAISELPNRIQFLEDLEDLSRDCVGERRFAVVFDLIAVDQLSHATRVMGSAIVDGMIKEAARNLRAIIGSERKAYHVGLAQLACLAPDDLNEAGYRDLLVANSKQLRELGGRNSIGTPSIGVAPFSLGELPPSEVLRIAQGAAMDARAAGKLFEFYSTNQDTAFQRSYQLLRDFEEAIKDPRDLHLVYQPRIDAASNRCAGLEALIRWNHPVFGAVSPAEFIPLVEHSFLATPMTDWVLVTALKQLSLWRREGFDVYVSVNISAANLRDLDFADTVQRALFEHDVPASALELEITETAVMTDAEQALVQLERLAASGVRLAIDDFGTGYSSLSYLQRLPVHVVKIDRSFMKDLDTDPRQLSLVTMMIEMSKYLGYSVVVEGVETQQVFDRLRTTKCDEIQGYFFARPLPAVDFAAWFNESRKASHVVSRTG